jgi:aminopeptidase-like protein
MDFSTATLAAHPALCLLLRQNRTVLHRISPPDVSENAALFQMSTPPTASGSETRSSELEAYFDRLWPICRSITGVGYRESLAILREIVPFESLTFPTGSHVFDWTVPREWVAREAYLVDPDGRRRADFAVNNLHLLGYSVAVTATMSLEELMPHLYSLPEQPHAIPYRTSYYEERWGFCLTHEELCSLPRGQYQVRIDTELRSGAIELGETVLAGESDREILLWSYLCHPSMANNELSGPLVLAFLYRKLAQKEQRKYTYRFAIGPETIGSLCYLSVRGAQLKKRLLSGFVLTCVGDAGAFTYKESRGGDSVGDRVVRAVLSHQGSHSIEPFSPLGSDERQFCSPGFDLPVGSLMRTKYGAYPQYHTSLDDRSFISFDAMRETVDVYERVLDGIEHNVRWKSLFPYGEPFLGKRGLYSTLGAQTDKLERQDALMWVLNYADGRHDMVDIALKSGLPLQMLIAVAHDAKKAGLIVPA